MRNSPKLLPVALLSALLTLGQPSHVQLAFGQEDVPQDDSSAADQPPPDQATPAPAPASDNTQWWQKQGGSNDLSIIIPLQNDYRQFWQFRSQALATLDTLPLTEVMFGGELADEEAGLHQLQADGKAQIVVVENHPQIQYASPDEAVVYDPYVSRSYFVDAKTRAPLGDGASAAPSTASIAYHLTRHPNHFGHLVWKVDDAVIFAQ